MWALNGICSHFQYFLGVHLEIPCTLQLRHCTVAVPVPYMYYMYYMYYVYQTPRQLFVTRLHWTTCKGEWKKSAELCITSHTIDSRVHRPMHSTIYGHMQWLFFCRCTESILLPVWEGGEHKSGNRKLATCSKCMVHDCISELKPADYYVFYA